MKLSSIAMIIGLAAEAQAAQTEYDEIRTLLDRIEENESAFAVAYAAKEAEVAELIDQLATCRADDDDGSYSSPSSSPSLQAPTTGSTDETSAVLLAASSSLLASPSSSVWTPRVGHGWNYNLGSPVDTDVNADVIFIDMDDAQSTVDELHTKGKWASCYINIGMVEAWRDDAEEFPAAAIGRALEGGYDGTKPVDPTHEGVKNIMEARVMNAAAMNCDAIEPDNMAIYAIEGKGFDLTEEDQIEYNMWFANTVHENGMLVGLKNAVALVPIIGSSFDFAVNEECLANNECDVYNDIFLDQDKPVFNVEYTRTTDMCVTANEQGLDTIIKNKDLMAPLCSCADPTRDVDCPSVA